MLAFLLIVCFQQETASMPFIKADVVCKNRQNEADKTFFTASCLKLMATNYKPVKVFRASYDKDGKEELHPAGQASCVYVNGDKIFARLELDEKLPQPISQYILNAKTYSSKGDFYISSSCIVEINKADIKYFVLRSKEKAITFD